MRRMVCAVALLLEVGVSPCANAGDAPDASASSIDIRSIDVSPRSVELVGPHAFQRFVVRGTRRDGTIVDLTSEALVESTDPKVATITRIDGEPRPAIVTAGNGRARVVTRWKGLEAEIEVGVREFDQPRMPRFTHDVMARLTHAGCNSGPCHGAQHGRGSFKLSLLGYEPDVDVRALREARARRINFVDSERSLIVEKPLGRVPHEGGRRFEAGSSTHRALRRWIEAGAPPPREDEPQVVGIEVFPPEMILQRMADPRKKSTAFFLATARLSDGSREDVTGRALLSSLNDGVATVDDSGRVVAVSSGATAIMVRYQGQAEVVRVTVPYRRVDEIANFEPENFIDEIVARKWKQLGLQPSRLSTDDEFIRRAFVSAIGTLPTPHEAKAFLDDEDPEKRAKLIDALLERPEYVDYWTLKWGDLLRIHRKTMNEKGMWSFYNWVRGELRENRPIDEMVRSLITAQGSTYTSGPTNFFRVAQRPKDLAETTSQVFLGVRLQCAQCHHHPFEKWTQQDYWGLAAYFARLGIKSSSEFGVYGREQVVYVEKSGEVRFPKTGNVMEPKPLGAPPEDDPTDRRRALARWLTSRDNRLFARNLANRFWGYLMGRGVVEPIDDLRVTNPPSNPELLDALADEVIRDGFDQKALIRTIMRSRLFQLSSETTAENKDDRVFFSHYLVRRLPSEVLHDAICAVTGVSESFGGLPPGSRAIQLPDPEFNSYFLESFGKPKRALPCECERVSRPNMAQALHLINGDFIQKRVTSSKGRVARNAETESADEAVVEEFYLAAFARRPAPDELRRAKMFIAEAPKRKEGLEDLLWALCNSSEFLFVH